MSNRALAPAHQITSLGTPAEQSTSLGYTDYELAPVSAGIDLGAIWSLIVRNRWLIAAVMLLAVGGGIASVQLTRPIYRAEASIQVDPQTLPILDTRDIAPDIPRSEGDRYLQTQIDILTSRATAQKVAATLNLKNDDDFLRDVGLEAERGDADLESRLASALGERLTVYLPPNSRIIGISYDSHDPKMAANIANRFAETFILDSLNRRIETYGFSQKLLKTQLSDTKRRLEASERALISYARSAGLVDAGGVAGAAISEKEMRSLTAAVLQDMNATYSQARATRVAAEQRWQQARVTPLMNLPEVLSNQAILDLTKRRAELQASFQQESQRRKADHPSIIQAAALLKELDRQINVLASGIRKSIEDQYSVARRQEDALRSNIAQLKSSVFDEQSKGVAYNILKREVDTNRDLYNALLRRYHEVRTQAADTNSTVSIIDRAQPPMSARYPQPAVNMALAIVAGALAALVAVLMRTKLDRRVHSPSTIEQDFGVPLLGVVPLLKGPETLERALVDPRSEISEAHHSICLSLNSIAKSPTCAVLLVTSTSPDEGKSTTAFKLGLNFAAAHKRVLLIDGDMRCGTLHRTLQLPNGIGLSDLLEVQNAGYARVYIQHSERYGFDFLPRGRSPSNPAELLASDCFGGVLSELRLYYDIVIIDGPPVMGLADAPRLAGLADGTLLVVEADRASKQHARIALKRLYEAEANQVGIVLTKYNSAQDYGAYSYSYRYDYGSDASDLRDRPVETFEADESQRTTA